MMKFTHESLIEEYEITPYTLAILPCKLWE